jgi:hypothetical protein
MGYWLWNGKLRHNLSSTRQLGNRCAGIYQMQMCLSSQCNRLSFDIYRNNYSDVDLHLQSRPKKGLTI